MSVFEKDITSTPSNKKRSIFAFLLVVMLAFTMMFAIACTPTDDEPEASETQSETADVPNTGGFTVEDSVEIEVDIDE